MRQRRGGRGGRRLEDEEGSPAAISRKNQSDAQTGMGWPAHKEQGTYEIATMHSSLCYMLRPESVKINRSQHGLSQPLMLGIKWIVMVNKIRLAQ